MNCPNGYTMGSNGVCQQSNGYAEGGPLRKKMNRGCSCERTSWWDLARTCQGSNCQNPGQACWGGGCPEKGTKDKYRAVLKRGGLSNKPNLSRQGNIGIRPDVRDDCWDNCEDINAERNQCLAATYPPGISGCQCTQNTYWNNVWDPATGTWGPSGNVNPTWQCWWNGQSFGQCMSNCAGHYGGGAGGRAYIPGIGGSSGTGRLAKGGRIRRHRQSRRRRRR